MHLDMAKEKITDVNSIEPKERKAPLKKGFALYPLKKSIKIGDTVRPIGFEIPLSKDGYRFYKQKNIV